MTFKAPIRAYVMALSFLALTTACGILPKYDVTPVNRPKVTDSRSKWIGERMDSILAGKATLNDITRTLGIGTNGMREVNGGVTDQWVAAQAWANGQKYKKEVLEAAWKDFENYWNDKLSLRVLGAWATPQDVSLKQFLRMQDSLYAGGFSRISGKEMGAKLDRAAWKKIQNSHLKDYPLACAFYFVEDYIACNGTCSNGPKLDAALAAHEAFCSKVVLDGAAEVLHLSNNGENILRREAKTELDSMVAYQNFGHRALFYPAHVWFLAKAARAGYYLWQGSGQKDAAGRDNDGRDAFLDSIQTSQKPLFVAVDGHGQPDEISVSTDAKYTLAKLELGPLYRAFKARARSARGQPTTAMIFSCYDHDFVSALLGQWRADADLKNVEPPDFVVFSRPGQETQGLPTSVLSAMAEHVQGPITGGDLMRWLQGFNFAQDEKIRPAFFYAPQQAPVQVSEYGQR
ncbi:Uncharacterised protein [uncultured archaeon]|nr:Uncharacterised protein [uncultured archaeon]